MALQDLMTEHQRLVVLRLLNEVSGFELNESILQDGLARYGLTISRDALRTQLYWLAEQQYIKLETVGQTLLASLTQRGLDVALGHAFVPGIKRPRPNL